MLNQCKDCKTTPVLKNTYEIGKFLGTYYPAVQVKCACNKEWAKWSSEIVATEIWNRVNA